MYHHWGPSRRPKSPSTLFRQPPSWVLLNTPPPPCLLTPFPRLSSPTIRQRHENLPSVLLDSTPISCVKDDENFVRSGGKYNRRRLLFLWRVVYSCMSRYNLALQVWLRLLEGSVDDDVWLWVDGDEEEIEAQDVFGRVEPKATDWDKALSALSRRLKRTEKEEPVRLKERRRRVQEADLKTRMSIIAWLVATSEAMRVTDASRGIRRRDIWDFAGLIADWYLSCEYHDTPIIPMTPNDSDSDVFQAFCDAMTTHGHTCHDQRIFLKRWIWMRLILNPFQRHVVYLAIRENSSCPPCAEQAQLLNRSSASDSHLGFQYHPPHHLVFLWILWSATKPDTTSAGSEWPKHLNRMACQKSSPLLNISTLKSVDSWLDTFPSETTSGRYLPWVNLYPQCWRYPCTEISSCEWQQAETSIRAMTQETEPSCSFDIHGSPTSVNIRTWIGAVLLLSWDASNSNSDFFHNPKHFRSIVNDYRVKDILKSIPTTPEVEPTATVINIRRAAKAAQESHHTCYERFRPALLDWYASAVSMITGTGHTEFVPFIGDEPDCFPCKTTKCLRDLVTKGKSFSSIERQQKFKLVHRELASMMAQEGPQLELPTGDSRLGLSLPPNGETSHRQEENSVASLNGGSNIGMSHSSNRVENGLHNQQAQDNTEALDSETSRRDGGTVLTPPQRPKRCLMIKEIKLHFIKLLEDLGVPILGVKAKQLPWTTLCTLLAERGWELDNWPAGVPLPGSGDQSCDDNKGINGLDLKRLYLLYDAMKSETCPLGFRKIVDTTVPAAVVGGSQVSDRSAGNNSDVIHESTIAQPDTSRRRPRDSQDADDVETPPGKRLRMSEGNFLISGRLGGGSSTR